MTELLKLSVTPNDRFVFVGSGVIKFLREQISEGSYSSLVVFSDRTVAPLWLSSLQDLHARQSSYLVPIGENAKCLEVAALCWQHLVNHKADRNTLVINLGGGSVIDLGGFVASCFYRGLDFINIPTTLLAQVDASIGGKVGINFESIKNCLGYFQSPHAVFCDTDFLSTLPPLELASGFAEIIKHGLIASAAHFQHAMSYLDTPTLSLSMATLIYESLQIKNQIVTKDPKEAGERKLLNFGHTVGHALESIALQSSSPMLHGEAIALGMLVETQLAENLKIAQQGLTAIVRDALNKAHLPTHISAALKQNLPLLDAFIRADKKNREQRITIAVPESVGVGKIISGVQMDAIHSAIASLC